ncbi:MAG TPA: glycosyl hydrolase [Gemmatimonadaceae bacterium]|nr:glycosyl hydrolase [Gemmatimonadaceae bacterium]
MRITRPLLATLALVAVSPCRVASAQRPSDSLEIGFRTPPASARPRTWWHWTQSNVTKEGITKDLEWMKRVGIAGFQLADVNAGGGQTVERKIVFGTPEWLDAVRHAAAEADRLGLEMDLFASPGWSLTGGPWVKPAQAMKKLVWSDTIVQGPRRVSMVLPHPPINNGPIRNLARGGNAAADPTFYGDDAVIAYRTPADERDVAALRPVVTTHAGPADGAALLDDDLNSALTVRPPADGAPAWIQLAFAEPITIRALSLASRGSGVPFGRVLAGDDAARLRTILTLPGAQQYRPSSVRTYDVPETRARVIRLELTSAAPSPAAVMSQAPTQPAREYVITEFVTHTGARVHRWEEKAGFNFLFEYESSPTPTQPATSVVPRGDVVDLTSRMKPDGTLDWEVPAGRWTVMRFGRSLTGAKNRPAVPAASGYEVDKLNRAHVEAYLRDYTAPIAGALGPLYGKSLRHVLLDSWEAGIQNWTDDMIAAFRTRRGYDPIPFLPALAGRVVESADASDRFLWDFRRTLVDMFAEEHYGTATEFLHKQGLQTYSEASGVSLEPLEDVLLSKKQVDIPMGEFWFRSLHPWNMYYVDVRGAASAAHVYGKPLVASESWTGGGYDSPYSLKKIGDYWLAQGINRLIFHTSAHQPLDTKPGNTMVGTHINRNITWAERAAPFMTYLSRSSFLLQQGKPVADLLYLLNEGAPSTMPFWGAGLQPAPPPGFDYDYANADVVLTRLSVAPDGALVLPDGVRYRVLVLPQIDRMTLPVLRKIAELVRGGATVLGPRPVATPSLVGGPAAETEHAALAEELWGDLDGQHRTRRRVGSGMVVWGQPLAAVLAAATVNPDVSFSQPLDGEIAWIHRRTADADIYYLTTSAASAAEVDIRFRVAGKEPELWRPDAGTMEPASYRADSGRTTVRVPFTQHDALFVVFRRPAPDAPRVVPAVTRTTLATVGGPWRVQFEPGLGAPASIVLPTLQPWSASADSGVKFFSGTATYTRTVQVPASWLARGRTVLLSLGDVRDMAEVVVNGTTLPLVWKAPFEVDVTRALRAGTNQVEIRVTNEWTNRLIGDRASPQKRVLTAGAPAGFGGTPPLPQSGLLGPVTLVSVESH